MVLSSCFRGPEKGKWLDNQSGRAEATSGWVTISKRECVIGKQRQTSLLYRTFPHGRRGDYNGFPKTLNGRHVGVQRQSSGSWIIFLICKRSFIFCFPKIGKMYSCFPYFRIVLLKMRRSRASFYYAPNSILVTWSNRCVTLRRTMKAWENANCWHTLISSHMLIWITKAQWFYLMSNRFLYNLLWTSIFDNAQ